MRRRLGILRMRVLRRRAHAKIDAAYWAFTRQRRGKPPVLVVPGAYELRARIDRVLPRAERLWEWRARRVQLRGAS